MINSYYKLYKNLNKGYYFQEIISLFQYAPYILHAHFFFDKNGSIWKFRNLFWAQKRTWHRQVRLISYIEGRFKRCSRHTLRATHDGMFVQRDCAVKVKNLKISRPRTGSRAAETGPFKIMANVRRQRAGLSPLFSAQKTKSGI